MTKIIESAEKLRYVLNEATAKDAEKVIIDMFTNDQYKGRVPDYVIKAMLKKDSVWVKKYGKINIMKAWLGLADRIRRHLQTWVWEG